MSEGTISRRRQFAQVPDALVLDRRVNDFAVRLWCRLDHYAGMDGRAFPHVDTLADDLGVSSRTVDRGIRCLVETGWVSRKRRGFSNIVDTVINDEPSSGAQQTSRSDASVQVAAETSDLTFPEAQDLSSPVTTDLSLPRKETHSKETQGNFFAPSAGAASADETAPATKPTSSKPRATERGTRLPEDWQPDPALRQWTRENCPSVGWADVERFRNYWLAKPGKDGRKIRWDLTWRNWAMKAQEDHIPRRPAHQDRATVDAAWSQWSDHGDELLAANGARNVLDLMW